MKNTVRSKDYITSLKNATQPARYNESSTTRPNFEITAADTNKTERILNSKVIDPKSGVMAEDDDVHLAFNY